jgi:hypothetical protein
MSALPRSTAPSLPFVALPPTWVVVAGERIEVTTRAVVLRDASTLEPESPIARSVSEVVGVGPLDPTVPVLLTGATEADDVGAASALVRRGARVLLTRHEQAVRRTADVLAAIAEAR